MGGIELELMEGRYRWRFAGGSGFTEDAADIMRDVRHWGVRRERLGFSDPRAHRLGARRMVDLELIWLLGILSVTDAHPYYASAAFAFALTDAGGSGMAGFSYSTNGTPSFS